MLRGVRGVGCFLRFGQEDFIRLRNRRKFAHNRCRGKRFRFYRDLVLRFLRDFFLFFGSCIWGQQLSENGSLIKGVEVEYGELRLEGLISVEAIDSVVSLGSEENRYLDFLAFEPADESTTTVVSRIERIAEGAGSRNECEGECGSFPDKGSEDRLGLAGEETVVL